MNFKQNDIANFLIPELYKQNIVIIDEQKSTTDNSILINKPEEDSTISYLGKNEKKIAIIVKEQHAVFLQDEQLNFITTLLNACKFNLADVAIINIESQEINYRQLKLQLDTKFILLFDVSTEKIGLPFTIPQYQMQNYDGCKTITSAPLSLLLNNSTEAKLHKSKLWVCLKNMFEIK